MGEPSLRSWPLVACAVLGASLAGCTKTGLAWVNEPESGVDLHPPPSTSASEPGSRSVAPTTTPVAPAAAPATNADPAAAPYGSRPRLDRSITLGGTTEFAGRVERAEARPAGAANVVNIYVTPSPGYMYGPTYGVGSAFYPSGFFSSGGAFVSSRAAGAGFSNAPATTTPTMRPGLDWPSVPNYGPAFPYHMGPASPWSGPDGRRR